jgi:hypothetical protein
MKRKPSREWWISIGESQARFDGIATPLEIPVKQRAVGSIKIEALEEVYPAFKKVTAAHPTV